jgi:hypothetical protein
MSLQDAHFLTLRGLSRKSGLSESTLRRRVRDGSLNAIQPGGRGKKLLFSPDVLDLCGSSAASIADAAETSSDQDLIDASQPADIADAAESLPGRRPDWMPRTQSHD